jgi:hypothetical protein
MIILFLEWISYHLMGCCPTGPLLSLQEACNGESKIAFIIRIYAVVIMIIIYILTQLISIPVIDHTLFIKVLKTTPWPYQCPPRRASPSSTLLSTLIFHQKFMKDIISFMNKICSHQIVSPIK